MSHCVICLERGTNEKPLIKPCRTCNIETHQECILNLISTHLISERFTLRYNLQYLLKDHKGTIIQSEDGILLTNDYNNLLLNCTAFDDNRKSFYLKYFRRGNGIINLKPPSFSIKNILDVIYIRDLRNPMIYLNDLCPQCKRDIPFVSPIKNISVFNNSLGIDNILIIIAKRIFSIESIDFINLSKHLLRLVTLSSSLFPWLYLDRNFMIQSDNYYNIEDISQFNSLIDPICLAVETTFSVINGISIYRLIYLTINRNKSLLSYMKFLKLLIKQIHRFCYAFTFNFIYLKWTIKSNVSFGYNFDCDETNNIIQDMNYLETILLLLCYDFKNVFYDTWNSKILENDNTTILPFMSLDSSFDSPFNAICLTLIGSKFGDKILSKFKPLTKLIYRIFKKFKPLPIEIEMIFEYLGYEVMLFAKTIFEFLVVYSNYKSLASFRVIKSVK